MRIENNRIYITQGELWTYDIRIVNRDGSPYFVPSSYLDEENGKYPYFVFVITNDENRTSEETVIRDRYFLKYKQKMFLDTVAIEITDKPYTVDANDYVNYKDKIFSTDGTYWYIDADTYNVKDINTEDYCRIIMAFTKDDTIKYPVGTYNYALYLVSCKDDYTDLTQIKCIVKDILVIETNYMEEYKNG